MKTSVLLASTALALLAAAPPAEARAQRHKPSYDELLRRLETLEHRVDEQQRIIDQRQQAAPTPQGAQAQQNVADIRTRLTTLEQNAADTSWSFNNGRPTIKSGDGRFQMSVRGRFHVDAASYSQDHSYPASHPVPQAQRDFASGVVVRRAQLGVEGRAFKDFWYEMRLDFGGSSSEGESSLVNLARVAYIGIPDWRINAGVIEPVFTYGNSVSSNEITFIERADVVNIATGAFGGGDTRRGIEVNFQRQGVFQPSDNVTFSVGYTGQTTQNNASIPTNHGTDEGTQVIGRGTYRLWSDGTSNIQIGANAAEITSLSGASFPGGQRNLQFRDRPETRVGLEGQRLVDTGAIPARGGWLWGLEAGANWENLYLAGEYYRFGVDRDTRLRPDCPACIAAPDPEFSGWYLEGSWVITGEAKSYSAANMANNYAVWGNPQVVKPFSFDGNSWGAWEAAVRYSSLDLDWHPGQRFLPAPVGGIRGGQEKIWTFGLNWYLNNNIRMMFNYLTINVDRLDSTGLPQGQNLNAADGRLQFAF